MTNNFAGFWKRLLAGMLDMLLSAAPITLLLLYAAQSITLGELWQRIFLLLLYVLFPLLGVLYTTIPTYYFGGSVGKLLTGLRVTDEKGTPLSFHRILFRHTIGYMFAGAAFSVGFLAIAKDSKKQGWHDKAVGSLVVETHKLWLVALLVLVALAFLHGYVLKNAWQAISYSPLRFQLHDLAATAVEDTQKSAQQPDQSNYYPEATLSREWRTKITESTQMQQKAQFAKATQQAQALLNSAQTQNEKAVAHKLLGAIAYQQGNYTLAKTHVQQSVDLYPNYVSALEYLALTEIGLGNTTAARQHAEKTVSLTPQDPSAHYTKALVLMALKDTVHAKEAIQKAIALDPQTDLYRQILQQIEKATPSPSPVR